MDSDLADPPACAVIAGRVRYGRYRHPIARIELPLGLLGRWRLKEWHYLSVTSERWFLAFAIAQLGYVANVFCYLVDRSDPDRARRFEAMLPLGRGVRIAESSTRGITHFGRRRQHIDVRAADGWKVDMRLPMGDDTLEGSFHVACADDSLALLHRLRGDRPAYTHKAAALPVTGRLGLGAQTLELDGALAASDWTRSVALRETRWKWASLAVHAADGRRVGLNLSAEVYDDDDGNSRENALWIDGSVRALGGVRFEVPRDRQKEPWRIVSHGGEALDLTFRPLGERAQHLEVGPLVTDFVQAFGLFEGSISPGGAAPIALRDAFGVVEDHWARW